MDFLFFALFLIYAFVLIRCWGIKTNWHSDDIDIAMELERLLHGGKERRIEMASNFLAFVPFGFALSMYLSSIRKNNFKRWIGLVVFVAFLLSLSIECMQLILHIGYFELTDLLMNTAGTLFGAAIVVTGFFVKKWLLD